MLARSKARRKTKYQIKSDFKDNKIRSSIRKIFPEKSQCQQVCFTGTEHNRKHNQQNPDSTYKNNHMYTSHTHSQIGQTYTSTNLVEEKYTQAHTYSFTLKI